MAILVLSGSVVACADLEMPMIDPPVLHLDPPMRQSNLPRGDYVLTNGQAEVLLEAEDLKPAQERTATFPLEKLDGIVNVVVRKDDEMIYTQTLRHTPGVPIKLRWDIDRAAFVLTENPVSRPAGSAAGDGGGGGRD
ncbi:MAG: hypothetical protein ACFCUW_02110 [Kiloniellaceae bacterium]